MTRKLTSNRTGKRTVKITVFEATSQKVLGASLLFCLACSAQAGNVATTTKATSKTATTTTTRIPRPTRPTRATRPSATKPAENQAASTSASTAAVVREDNSQAGKDLGIPLYVWHDSLSASPRGIVIAVHGAAQDGAAMNGLATNLASKGYFVVAPDLRGNGRWQFTKVPTNETTDVLLAQSCADLERLLVLLRRTFPGKDIVLIGESIGAGVVMKAATDSPPDIKGVILCSAGVSPHVHNPLNMKSSFIKGMALMVHPVDVTDYMSRYCSDDPRIAHEMVTDPLGRSHQSGLELLGTFSFLNQEPGFAQAMPPSIPVLMIQGLKDQIVDPLSASKIYDVLRTPDKRMVTLPQSGHILIGTSFIKPEVLASINDWITACSGRFHAKSATN